jgi:SOS-response transcriptional repressor LexA
VNAACAAFSKALADLGKEDGVRVNCIHPSLVETERQWRRIRAEVERTGETEAAVRERIAPETGITRFGTVEDVADLVTFLVSSRASWLTGVAAAGTPIDVFLQLINDDSRDVARQSVPILAFSQAGEPGRFDAVGHPVGPSWDEIIPLPAVEDEHTYALEISGNSLEPTYRDGTMIVLSPAASIRRGDRVVVKIGPKQKTRRQSA